MTPQRTVAIIDYGSGNLRSVEKAFAHAARTLGSGDAIQVTGDPAQVAAADRVVLPGVGAFGDCRRGLLAIDGMMEALDHAIVKKARPFLGICVGMQLMARRGFEHGEHAGFGWIGGEVAEIAPEDANLKIPHMGWNDLCLSDKGAAHPVLQGLGADHRNGQGAHVYFVHSYAMQRVAETEILARVDYGGPIIAAVGRDNVVGTQFHPEKSQGFGLRLIANFLEWCP